MSYDYEVKGEYSLEFNLDKHSTGVYFVRFSFLSSGDKDNKRNVMIKKILLLN